ncbi:MAG: Rpn family recombination-promoting nuclease/putative transposase [Lachnospiraceae bacterium]|nr:Rpn family recombination-promoting nuclease/putative transposase [Lachnospiraceae bacterium]
MSNKDGAAKELMNDSRLFADVFNYFLYNGKQVIDPDELRALDTTQVVVPYENEKELIILQRFRDKFKSAVVMTDENGTYVLLGLENQAYINYAMPARNMLYDAMRYAEQVESIAGRHVKDHDRGQKDEFMSGFKKDDRIKPIITLTILWSPEKWDAATSLYEMFDTKDENILKYVPNYRLNLLTPEQLQEEDFERFTTELKNVLYIIKYSNNKKELQRLFDKKQFKRVVRRKTLGIINILIDTHLEVDDEEEEEIDLCIAIEGIKDDARNEGISIGIEQGIEQGIEKGIEKGIEQGMEKGSVLSLYKLVEQGIISVEIAAAQSGMPVSEFETKAKEYTKENKN